MHNGVSEFSFHTFLAFVGTSNEKVAGDYIRDHRIGKNVGELVLEKQAIYMGLLPEIELCRGARQVLATYQGRITMAVASSSHTKEVLAILKAHNLLDYFSTVIGGDMVKNKKPDPEIYIKASKILGVPAASCIAFEDSSHGLNAAKSAQMYGVAVPNEFTRNHDFSRADKVIDSLAEVDDLLLGILTRKNQI